MKSWEYIFLQYAGFEDWVQLLEEINSAGEQGWELVAITDDLHTKRVDVEAKLFIFKKPFEE